MSVCRGMKGLRASTEMVEETRLVLSVQLMRLSVDEWTQRWTNEGRQLRLCVKVTVEQVLTAGTFVGKQIHLCKGHHLFHLTLSLFISSSFFLCPASSSSHLLSVYSSSSWVIFMKNSSCRWLVIGREKRRLQHYQHSVSTNLAARPRVATLQLSLDSSRYPPALHANRDGLPLLQLAAAGPLPVCHPLTPTHTHTPATMLANTHPLLSALPPVQERKLSQRLHWGDVLFRQHS